MVMVVVVVVVIVVVVVVVVVVEVVIAVAVVCMSLLTEFNEIPSCSKTRQGNCSEATSYAHMLLVVVF